MAQRATQLATAGKDWLSTEGSKLLLLAPVVQERKGEHLQLLADLRAQGFVRARINGEVCELDDPPKLDWRRKHSIDVVVDRFKVRDDLQVSRPIRLIYNGIDEQRFLPPRNKRRSER